MKIVKKAVQIGNGAAVYVPKEYSGREVVVLVSEGVDELKERVLNLSITYKGGVSWVLLLLEVL